MARGAQAMSGIAPGFERRSRPIDPSPVRFYFIPESWFQFFYPKTGHTGPYMFMTGVTTYLVSKEIYVLEHEFYSGCTILIMILYAINKFGPATSKWLEEKVDAEDNALINSRQSEIDALEQVIEHEKKEQWRTDAQILIFEAKKENILMQLEAAYRERLATVGIEVKKRLDYQLQIHNVERRVGQKHMAQWIISNVLKAITPDQEKASLQQCIKDLQALAPRA